LGEIEMEDAALQDTVNRTHSTLLGAAYYRNAPTLSSRKRVSSTHKRVESDLGSTRVNVEVSIGVVDML